MTTTITTVLAICLPFVLGSIWAIVDAGLRDFGSPGRRALWVLVAATPFLGVVIYLLVGRRRGRRATPRSSNGEVNSD